MPEPSAHHPEVELPEELRAQIESFRKQLWRIKVIEVFFAGLFGLLVSFIAILAVERFVEIPTWVRILNLALGFSIFSIFAPIWVNRWVFRHRRENQIARLIAKKFPHLGDRILGVIELQGQDSEIEGLSPELKAAAIRSVARDTKNRDLSEALPDSWHKRWLIGVSLTVVAAVISFIYMPEAGMNSLKRWLTPWSDTERFTFTQIDVDQYKDGYIVPLQTDFNIDVALRPGSQLHDTGEAQCGKESKTSDFNGDTAQFAFKGKSKPVTVDIKVGDATAQVEIIPMALPHIKKSTAYIQWPSYLEIDTPQEIHLTDGSISPLEGSVVHFRSQANRAIAKTTASPVWIESDKVNVGEDESFDISEEELLLTLDGDSIQTNSFTVGEKKLKFNYSYKDIHDLTNPKKPASFVISPVKDMAPEAYLRNSVSTVTKLIGEPITFEFGLNDDYGLLKSGIAWFNEEETLIGSNTLYFPKKGEKKELHFSDKYIFNPATHGILTPQTLVFKSWAVDQFPGRKNVYSMQTFTVEYISAAEMARRQLDSIEKMEEDILSAYEDSLENEAQTADLMHRLKQAQQKANSSDAKEAQDGKKQLNDLNKKIEDLKDKEKDIQDELDKIAESASELFKKAAEENTLDKETLKKLHALEQTLKKANKQKGKAQKNMQKAQQNGEQNNSSESQQDLKKANKNQKDALDELQKAAKQARSAKEQSEQGTFVKRLQKAAKEQRAIAEALTAPIYAAGIDKDAATAPYGDAKGFNNVLPSQKKAFSSAYKLQNQVRKDMSWLLEELDEFHARTQKQGIEKVLQDMENKNIDEGLHYNTTLLEDSQWSHASYRSEDWAFYMDEWAKALSQAGGGGGGGGEGGGGGGGDQLNDDDFDFLLRIMRMVKKQQEIRHRTRAMEQFRRSYEGTVKPASPKAPKIPTAAKATQP